MHQACTLQWMYNFTSTLQFRHQNWLLKGKKVCLSTTCVWIHASYNALIHHLMVYHSINDKMIAIRLQYIYREKWLLESQQQTYYINVCFVGLSLSFCASLFLFVSSLSQMALTVSQGNLNLGSPSYGKERSLLSWSIVRLPQAARCGQMNNCEKREWK